MFIRGENISVAVVQIAGMLARRIVCSASVGDSVKQGERLGCIRLGSQVDVIFPALDDMSIEVREHRKGKAGIDPLASFHHSTELRSDDLSEPVEDSRIGEYVGIVLERCLNWTLLAYLYVRLAARSIIHFFERHEVKSKGD